MKENLGVLYHKGPVEYGVGPIESDLRVCHIALVVATTVNHDVTKVPGVAVTAKSHRP